MTVKMSREGEIWVGLSRDWETTKHFHGRLACGVWGPTTNTKLAKTVWGVRRFLRGKILLAGRLLGLDHMYLVSRSKTSTALLPHLTTQSWVTIRAWGIGTQDKRNLASQDEHTYLPWWTYFWISNLWQQRFASIWKYHGWTSIHETGPRTLLDNKMHICARPYIRSCIGCMSHTHAFYSWCSKASLDCP